MENNSVKENYLEVIPQQGMVLKKEKNNLPVLKDCKKLLPVIIEKKELALVKINNELSTIKQNKVTAIILAGLMVIAKVLKITGILFAKLVRWCILAVTRCASIVVVSAVVLLSTTIVTKNIVNSYCGAELNNDDTAFSVFNIKDDEEAIKSKSVEKTIENNQMAEDGTGE